jgi:hypothetical protein
MKNFEQAWGTAVQDSLSPHLIPGALVRHPSQPDWGIGQVQSAIGHRVTVNFEHAGKQLIDTRIIALEPATPRRTG